MSERPHRVQVRGSLFKPEVPADAVYVGRNGPYLRRSKWANPFKPGRVTPVTVRLGGRAWTVGAPLVGNWPSDMEAAVDWYRALIDHAGLHGQIRTELAGRVLACWCYLTAPCHADTLLIISNERPEH